MSRKEIPPTASAAPPARAMRKTVLAQGLKRALTNLPGYGDDAVGCVCCACLRAAVLRRLNYSTSRGRAKDVLPQVRAIVATRSLMSTGPSAAPLTRGARDRARPLPVR